MTSRHWLGDPLALFTDPKFQQKFLLIGEGHGCYATEKKISGERDRVNEKQKRTLTKWSGQPLVGRPGVMIPLAALLIRHRLNQ